MLLSSVEPSQEIENKSNKDWPSHIPMPSDDDIAFMADMSERNTGSCFFDIEKRSDKNGGPSSRDRRKRYYKGQNF